MLDPSIQAGILYVRISFLATVIVGAMLCYVRVCNGASTVKRQAIQSDGWYGLDSLQNRQIKPVAIWKIKAVYQHSANANPHRPAPCSNYYLEMRTITPGWLFTSWAEYWIPPSSCLCGSDTTGA